MTYKSLNPGVASLKAGEGDFEVSSPERYLALIIGQAQVVAGKAVVLQERSR